MNTVNITDVPLFSKDNVSVAIQVALRHYPAGARLYFPSGTYYFNTHKSFAGERNHPKTGLALCGIFDPDTVPFLRNRLIDAQFPRMKRPAPAISWVEFLKSL